jgi:hypothetical protein
MWNCVVVSSVDRMSEESNKRKDARNSNEKGVKKCKKEYFSFGQSAGTKVIMSDHIRSFPWCPKTTKQSFGNNKRKGESGSV